MERRIEAVDMMAAVGVFATIVGGAFLFMATNAEWTSKLSDTATEQMASLGGSTAAMQWVQPALGQALVENYLLDRAAIVDMNAAAKELNHVALMSHYRENGVDPSFAGMTDRIAEIDADHASRVQYVMGRAIVLFTARGIRSGELTPMSIDGAYNKRMIALTEDRGQQLEMAYQDSREPLIGRMIVTAAYEATQADEQIQNRLGQAIIRIATLQEDHQAKGNAQAQLGLVALASLHAEQVADRFESLASAERSLQPTSATVFVGPSAWPDMSVGLLMAGCIGLIGLFCVGLMLPGSKPDEQPVLRDVPAEPVYRKTG
jgi:hypothetical protein